MGGGGGGGVERGDGARCSVCMYDIFFTGDGKGRSRVEEGSRGRAGAGEGGLPVWRSLACDACMVHGYKGWT